MAAQNKASGFLVIIYLQPYQFTIILKAWDLVDASLRKSS